MLLALKLVTSATAPLREATLFHNVMANLGTEHLLAFLIGAIVTWLSYSSLAVMLLIASFVANGSLEVSGALALVLGVNLGGGLPAFISTAQFEPRARRLPLANLLCRAVGAAVLLPLVPSLTEPFSRLGGDPVHQVLGAHMAFNIGLALICLPLCGLIMQSMERLLPDQRPVDDPLSKPKYLDRMAFQSPNVALSNAALETVRMAELLERMFRTAVEALKSNKAEGLKGDPRIGRAAQWVPARHSNLYR